MMTDTELRNGESMEDVRILGPDDLLDGVPVLEGFSIRVSELFE